MKANEPKVINEFWGAILSTHLYPTVLKIESENKNQLERELLSVITAIIGMSKNEITHIPNDTCTPSTTIGAE